MSAFKDACTVGLGLCKVELRIASKMIARLAVEKPSREAYIFAAINTVILGGC